MSGISTVVMAGLDPAIHRTNDAAIVAMMDARVEPAHDGGVGGAARPLTDVIPGRAQREPGIHPWSRGGRARSITRRGEYGFRACALRAHPGMTNDRLFGAANAEVAIVEASGAEVAGATAAKAEREIIQ
ncbi:MAG: hypothetical protein HZA66_16835 [Rhodopseudomonas palustris]|uniref:Uncharacterized protein n=1 Tax=Rhodopseudomonas palustris TaxID=1076 RepID=A0A933W3B3_RHOPL|nr:hypothetical protein [Rhodopseudomonas palustris]